VELSDGTVTAQADADMPPAITLNLRLAGQRTVLVIDDNADALQLAARCLIGSRYTFVGSRDPEQGLLVAARVAPCAIVLDVVLPGIDGWELLGRLRTHPATANIPVIVATILPQEQLALALGAAAFLRKPLSREALLTTLDELIKT
jgi:CheY-like chemotaxis protein